MVGHCQDSRIDCDRSACCFGVQHRCVCRPALTTGISAALVWQRKEKRVGLVLPVKLANALQRDCVGSAGEEQCMDLFADGFFLICQGHIVAQAIDCSYFLSLPSLCRTQQPRDNAGRQNRVGGSSRTGTLCVSDPLACVRIPRMAGTVRIGRKNALANPSRASTSGATP